MCNIFYYHHYYYHLEYCTMVPFIKTTDNYNVVMCSNGERCFICNITIYFREIFFRELEFKGSVLLENTKAFLWKLQICLFYPHKDQHMRFFFDEILRWIFLFTLNCFYNQKFLVGVGFCGAPANSYSHRFLRIGCLND